MNFNQIETLDCFIFYGSKSKRGWNSSNREVLHRLVLRAQKGEKHTPVRVWRQSSAQQSPCLHCCLSALAGCLTAPVELEVLIQWEAQRGNCPPPPPCSWPDVEWARQWRVSPAAAAGGSPEQCVAPQVVLQGCWPDVGCCHAWICMHVRFNDQIDTWDISLNGTPEILQSWHDRARSWKHLFSFSFF